MKTSTKKKWLFGIAVAVLFVTSALTEKVPNNNHIESGVSWPSWAGGSYESDECDCKEYFHPDGTPYYWRACKVKNLWGLNTVGWGEPGISNEPC